MLFQASRALEQIRANYPTVIELGWHSTGRGLRVGSTVSGELGYSDPTGSTIASEQKAAARSAAETARKRMSDALEALNVAQDALADVISPRRRWTTTQEKGA